MKERKQIDWSEISRHFPDKPVYFLRQFLDSKAVSLNQQRKFRKTLKAARKFLKRLEEEGRRTIRPTPLMICVQNQYLKAKNDWAREFVKKEIVESTPNPM